MLKRKKRDPLLRSPREILGGYIILPRLIDKVRLHSKGRLPSEYVQNLLSPGLTLDGRFLSFTGLEAESLRKAILSIQTDEEVLSWVNRHAISHTDEEKRQWGQEIAAYQPDPFWAEKRKSLYPELAAKMDVTKMSILDLIDRDEGRIPP